ncbi:hypothetical protein Tco_0296416 [Tanacetum coccineum]
MKAVPSTTYGMIKFPVMGGILTLRSSKIIPIECAMVSGLEDQPLPMNKVKKERIKVAINPEHPEQTVMIGSDLTEKTRSKLCNLLQRSLDIFAWTPTDMTGVPRQIAEHKLNVRKGCPPVRQKKRGQAAERNIAINDEVSKLVTAGIMREVHYHDWLSNPVMVKKSDNSWRMCVDFKDLNKACPKDGYPLPEIDWKVESLCGFPFKCFLDAYKGYHQIQMAEEDEEKTARTEDEVVRDIEETFKTLRKINMKLNPKKCTFGVEEGMFLGYQVNTKGIKICPDKVDAVLSLQSPKCLKDVQKLNGKLASLNSEAAFKQMKEHIAKLPMLITPEEQEELICLTDSAKEAGAPPKKQEQKGRCIKQNGVHQFCTSQQTGVGGGIERKILNEREVLAVVEEEGDTWMTPIHEYLTDETLPAERKKARAIKRKSQRFAIINGILYKKYFLGPWLRCVGPSQANTLCGR